MKYSSEDVDQIEQRLRSLPPIQNAKQHTKQQAVKLLSREINALKARGYSLDQIAESLSDSGLPITTPTLKNYLQRSRARKRPENRKPKQTRPPSSPPNTPPRTPPGTFTPRPDTDDI